MRTFIKKRGGGRPPKIWRIAIVEGGAEGRYMTEEGETGGRMKSSHGKAMIRKNLSLRDSVIHMANSMIRRQEELGYVEIYPDTDQPEALLFDNMPGKFTSFTPSPIEDGEPSTPVIAMMRKPCIPAYLLVNNHGMVRIFGRGEDGKLKNMSRRFPLLRREVSNLGILPFNCLIGVDLVFMHAAGLYSKRVMNAIMTLPEERALLLQGPEQGRVYMIMQFPFYIDGEKVMDTPVREWLGNFIESRWKRTSKSRYVCLPRPFITTLGKAHRIAKLRGEGLLAYNKNAILGELAFSLDGGFLYPDEVWEDQPI